MAREKDEDVTRILAMLRDAVRFSNLPNREVERRLGSASGSLSRLFAGSGELKLRQILDILEIVGLPPANFFRVAFSEPDDSPESLRMERILLHSYPLPRPETPEEVSAAPLTEAQVEEMMKKTLRRLLFSEEPPPPPPPKRK